MNRKPSRIGPFPAGVDNRKRDHELTDGAGRDAVDLLRSAINVDVTNEGRLRRRQGFQRVLPGAQVHSLWSDETACFFVDGQRLCLLDTQMRARDVRADLAPGQALSFCEAGGTYFYTGGGLLGMVRDGQRLDFASTPSPEPSIEVIAGALPPGRYQLCFTALGRAGESAATMPQVVTLEAAGGLRIRAAAAGATVLAYMTAADGEVLGRVGTVDGLLEVVAPPALGARCQTLLMAAMPPGAIVRFSNGRLLVASSNLLFYSEPFALGLFNPAKNFIAFPAPVTVVEPCGRGGVWVVADRTYWLAGEITQATLDVRLPYGSVPGTGMRHPDQADTAIWVSDRGLVVATGDGTATAVQEPRLALAGGPAGAVLARKQDGLQHIVTSVRDPMATTAASRAYFDAEIIRKGKKV